MKNVLLSRAPQQAVPLVVLPVVGYKAWLQKQKQIVQRWLVAQRFAANPGAFCAVPDATGGVALVIAILSDPVSRWDLAALPCALPEGTYKLVFNGTVPQTQKLALSWLLGTYRVRQKKGDPHPAELAIEAKINFTKVRTIAETIAMTRDLINRPAADLGPAELADAVVALGKAHGAKVTQIVGDALLDKGYRAIHAMGRASARPPRLIELTWGNPKNPQITLLGKGVCFDTGGLNLKTGGGMTLMRKDMAGAACALATAALVMANKLPVSLRLLIPAIENAIGGNAVRPSDVIEMRNGLTVQVSNTDAEGRMILADALVEGASTKPALLVDFATLGGANSVLGPLMGMFFTHDDTLASALAETSRETEDPLWRMPFCASYEKIVDGGAVADLNNAPSFPYAGGVVAAHFLDRFVGRKVPWIHLDFMAWNTFTRPGRPEGGEAMAVIATYRMIEKRFA